MMMQETPAKPRKVSGARNVSFTPQPMDMCTPLSNNPNKNEINYRYICPSNQLEHEMAITPCVRACRRAHKDSKLTDESKVKSNLSPFLEGKSDAANTSKLEDAVFEAEEMVKYVSLKNDRVKTVPNVSDFPYLKEQHYWLFFENTLKGFRDPQLR